MYNIIPYVAIGNIKLNIPAIEIEKELGKGFYKKGLYIENLIIGSYAKGIHLEYQFEIASFIGLVVSLHPVIYNHAFLNTEFNETLKFFKSFPGQIFTDHSVLISDYLGISTYFEDNELKEVGKLFHVPQIKVKGSPPIISNIGRRIRNLYTI